ncbi:MAG: putative cell wall-binding domain [Actinomycetia bacterium]|nr:putative cell wall-binding domain [Actinomycetes bacterium]
MRRRALPLLVAMLVVAAPSVSRAAEASGALAGRVVDATGAPVADVCVVAMGLAGPDGPGIAATSTGSDGRYRLGGLLPGTYSVGFSDCDPVPTYVDTTRTGITVVEGAASAADATLALGGFLAGRAVDSSGTPIGSVCVLVADPATEGQLGATTTARDGTYRVGPLPAGTAIVLFSDCGPTPSLIAQFLGGGLDVAAARRVSISPAVTAAGNDVTLVRGATIAGTVDDGTGTPHRGACLSADVPGATGLSTGASALAETDGTFVLGGLAAGTYHVGVGRCPATDGAGVDISVAAGQRVTDVRLALPASHVARLAGSGRVDTAVAVAGSLPSSTVLLARDDSPVDALAATPLAAFLDAPLLLTPSDHLAPSVLAYLREHKVTDAVLLGGSGALAPTVEAELSAAGVDTSRIAGPDRYATAAQIAGQLDATSAYVVADGDWPDAVAIGTLAALEGRPILLTAADALPDATAEVVGGMASVDVVGGRGAISDDVVDALAETVPHVGRIAGADRFETSSRAVRLGAAEGLPYDVAWVTGGRSWADGLVAAVAAARGGGPLLLLGPANRQLLRDHAAELADLRVVGGTVAVSAAAYTELATLPPSSCARTERC